MTIKLILIKIKSWLKTKIKNIVSENRPSVVYKYIPYKCGADSFLIPKSPECKYEICSLGLAIPPRKLWLGYGATKEEYLSWGEKHVSKMLELTRTSKFSFAKGDRILDFGCGAGRMIRHLKNLSESCEIWGTDIDAESIYWCKQFLSPPFNFATTTTAPHLPFEDRYFNYIYCGSVFTHIDDLAEAWLLELRRILSFDGRLYLTIHDNHTIKLFDDPSKNYSLIRTMKAHDLYVKSKNTFGMLTIGRGADSQIFYDIDYFCKTLSSMYQIFSVTEEAYGYQTAILVKTKSNRKTETK